MKLAIVIPGFQSGPGDWCIPAFTNLAHELAHSAEVHVFALRYPRFRCNYRIGSVRIHALGGGAFAGLGGRRVPIASLLSLWRLALADIATEHQRGGFDAILGFWATEAGWLATRAARSLRVPSIAHIAGGELVWIPAIGYGNAGRGLAGRLVSPTLKQADLVTAPSTPVREMLVQRFGVPAEKARCWPLGVDIERFQPKLYTGQVEGPFTFITVGSLIPVKGHTWLLEAASELRRLSPGLHFQLQIVGGGPLLSWFQQQVERLQLKGYVDLRGEVPYHRLPPILRQAHCFVLGSLYEAQCMAALEAMACGLPWIGPRVGALADAARQELACGMPVEERNPAALARAMHEMAALPTEARSRLGSAGRDLVEREYALRRQAERLLAHIKELEINSRKAN